MDPADQQGHEDATARRPGADRAPIEPLDDIGSPAGPIERADAERLMRPPLQAGAEWQSHRRPSRHLPPRQVRRSDASPP
jgi:hypothetical protein